MDQEQSCFDGETKQLRFNCRGSAGEFCPLFTGRSPHWILSRPNLIWMAFPVVELPGTWYNCTCTGEARKLACVRWVSDLLQYNTTSRVHVTTVLLAVTTSTPSSTVQVPRLLVTTIQVLNQSCISTIGTHQNRPTCFVCFVHHFVATNRSQHLFLINFNLRWPSRLALVGNNGKIFMPR